MSILYNSKKVIKFVVDLESECNEKETTIFIYHRPYNCFLY
jgi:hypothetical protein